MLNARRITNLFLDLQDAKVKRERRPKHLL